MWIIDVNVESAWAAMCMHTAYNGIKVAIKYRVSKTYGSHRRAELCVCVSRILKRFKRDTKIIRKEREKNFLF